MVETTTGLVLRTRPLTETSLIVHWLTADLGRLATVAKGARRPKSPFIGKLDLFYRADFSFARNKRSELHTLREVNLRETHEKLRQDIGMLQQAAYCAALIEQTTETDTPLPAIFKLFGDLLEHVAAEKARPQNIFAFEWKLLGELGLQPDLKEIKLSEGAKCLVGALEGSEWAALGNLRLSAGQITELRQFLHGFLVYHLGRIPKGRERAIMGM
jgi:DNA repair protein RecO (recombination protein O)